MAKRWLEYAPLGKLKNEDVLRVEQRTGVAFGSEYRYYAVTMKDGAEWKLRSVTQCLNCLNKEALIQWAVDECCRDIWDQIQWDENGTCLLTPGYLESVLDGARKAHYRKKEEAAALGTRAHKLIEDFLRTGIEPNLAEEHPAVQNSVTLALEWWTNQNLSVVNTELIVYDVANGYAGQLDFLAVDGSGAPVVFDWKTSKDIYWNMKLQVVAYGAALMSMGRGVASKLSIVRFGKEDATFDVCDIPQPTWKRLNSLFRNCIPLSDALREAESERRKKLEAERKAAERAEREGAVA